MLSELLLKTLTAKPVSSTMEWILGPHVTIYMLHRPRSADGSYDGTCPEFLDMALEYAKSSGFAFAYIDEIVGAALKGEQLKTPTLCFTLDDGYQDQVDVLAPILLSHGAKPTLYVLADMVESGYWPWDAQLIYAFWNTPIKRIDFSFNGESFSYALETNEQRIFARRKVIKFAKSLNAKNLELFL